MTAFSGPIHCGGLGKKYARRVGAPVKTACPSKILKRKEWKSSSGKLSKT
jgi:hypothetical protein